MVARQAPATALMIALAAVLYVVAAATSSEVLIMVAVMTRIRLEGL